MIFAFLLGLLGCRETPEEWKQMILSRTHMNAALCFHFNISSDDSGQMILKGYCTDKEGQEYRTEKGIVLTDETVQKLLGLELENFPAKKRKIFSVTDVNDKTVEKLILYDKNGKAKEKEISGEVIEFILDAIISEFLSYPDHILD